MSVEARIPASAVTLDRLQPVELRTLPHSPAVSVVITCYNYGPFVGQAIESCLEQTVQPAEIVVSDDGSTDNSCAVVDQYAAKHSAVKLVRNEHGGMASCLNSGYRASSGDIICLLDADDVFLPRKVELVIEAFKRNPKSGFVAHPAVLIDYKRRQRGVFPLLGALPQGDCAGETFRNAGILMGLPPTTNLSIRREVAERIFPISTEFTGYAEQMLHRLAPLMTEMARVAVPLAEWRQHGKNDQKATHLSAQRAEREMSVMSMLWLKQQEYLRSVNGQLADEFPTLEHSALYRKLRYVKARLRGEPEAGELHRILLAGDIGPSYEQTFWRVSKYLPRSVFSKAVDLLTTQNVVKEAIARLVKHG